MHQLKKFLNKSEDLHINKCYSFKYNPNYQVLLKISSFVVFNIHFRKTEGARKKRKK